MWPEREKTEQLLANAKAGDQEAVNHLMNRHRDSLHRMIRMRLDRAIASRVDASDVVQDVLLEASERLDDYISDPKVPFHLWLRQLAKDRMIDMHRRHRGAQRRSVDREQSFQASSPNDEESKKNLAAFLQDHELTPAAATIQKELEGRFLEAISLLDEADQEILLMRHFEQLGNGEVAEALGINPAAAGMRHLRALRRLREQLGMSPDGDVPEDA